jgi:Leucine-rich repeat (LRR) protein
MALTLEKINRSYESNYLVLWRDKINDDDIPLICKFLKEHPKIKTLYLDENAIDDRGAYLLSKNTTLTSLSIFNNNISSLGASALANHKTMTSLNIWNNDIGDVGACALAKSKSLRQLDVSCCNIGPIGAKALAKNTKLELAQDFQQPLSLPFLPFL